MSLKARVEKLEHRGTGAVHIVVGTSAAEHERKCRALVEAGHAQEADLFICVKRFAVEAASKNQARPARHRHG